MIAVIVYFIVNIQHLDELTHLMISWDVFSVCMIIMSWITFFITTSQQIREQAKVQDSSRILIFVTVFVLFRLIFFVLYFFLFLFTDTHTPSHINTPYPPLYPSSPHFICIHSCIPSVHITFLLVSRYLRWEKWEYTALMMVEYQLPDWIITMSLQ